jgi:hypothetical protein
MSNLPDLQPQDDAAPAVRYRSVSWPAILCLGIGVFSILTAFGYAFWAIPLLALALGWHGLKSIGATPEELTGAWFARGGIAATLVLWFAGFSMHQYAQTHYVPPGYAAITFDDLQPVSTADLIPPSAYDLEPSDRDRDRRIFIAGYIYPGRRMINLREFILVPTMSHCQSCQRQLKSTEMIAVTFTGDMKTDYTNGLVKVGGKFHIDNEQVTNPFGGLPYKLEADYFQE